MVTSDAKEEVPVREKETVPPEKSESMPIAHEDKEEKYDIIEYLQESKHKVKQYPNGVTLGLRFNPIDGSRSVHADFVYVLDWRTATFPRNPLAMKTAVLELLDRQTADIMSDLDLEHRTEMLERKTVKGTVTLPVIKQNVGKKKSFLRETRSVYVVTQETAPSIDFTWLTDPGRVVSAENFLLARKSDIRSAAPEIQKRINSKKWDSLQSGIELSWAGFLSAIFTAISFGTTLYVGLTRTASIFLPLISSIAGLIACTGFIAASRKKLSEFNEMMANENESIERVADDHRFQKAKESDPDLLEQVRTMRFIISPLMARVVGCINVRDFDGAIDAANKVLDELVRLSPFQDIESETDPGLDKFLELFRKLDTDIDEAALSVAYVALTDSSSALIESGKIIDHVAILLEGLYRCGIIPPESKTEMDQILNARGLKETKTSLDRDIAEAALRDKIKSEMLSDKVEEDELACIESYIQNLMEEYESGLKETESETKKGESIGGLDIPTIIAKTVDTETISSTEPSCESDIDTTASDVVRSAKSGVMAEEGD